VNLKKRYQDILIRNITRNGPARGDILFVSGELNRPAIERQAQMVTGHFAGRSASNFGWTAIELVKGAA